MVSWGGTIETGGMLYQLWNPKDGTKVNALGSAMEAFTKGTRAEQLDAANDVIQAVGTHFLIEKLGVDSWIGQLGILAVSNILANHAEDLIAEYVLVDPEKTADSPEAQTARDKAAAKTNAEINANKEQYLKMNSAALSGGVLATSQEIQQAGLNVTVASKDTHAFLKELNIDAPADAKDKEEFVADFKAKLQQQYVNGDITALPSATEINNRANAAYTEEFGNPPLAVQSREAFVRENRETSEMFIGHMGGGTHVKDQGYDEETRYLEYAWQTKVTAAAKAAEAKKANPGQAVDMQAILNEVAPTYAKDLDIRDHSAAGKLPLSAEAQTKLEQAGFSELMTQVDNAEYKEQYVDIVQASMQGRPGIDDYRDRDRREELAASKFEREEAGKPPSMRMMTREEYIEAHAVKEKREHVGRGVSAVTNGHEVKQSEELAGQRYDNLIAKAQAAVKGQQAPAQDQAKEQEANTQEQTKENTTQQQTTGATEKSQAAPKPQENRTTSQARPTSATRSSNNTASKAAGAAAGATVTVVGASAKAATDEKEESKISYVNNGNGKIVEHKPKTEAEKIVEAAKKKVEAAGDKEKEDLKNSQIKANTIEVKKEEAPAPQQAQNPSSLSAEQLKAARAEGQSLAVMEPADAVPLITMTNTPMDKINPGYEQAMLEGYAQEFGKGKNQADAIKAFAEMGGKKNQIDTEEEKLALKGLGFGKDKIQAIADLGDLNQDKLQAILKVGSELASNFGQNIEALDVSSIGGTPPHSVAVEQVFERSV